MLDYVLWEVGKSEPQIFWSIQRGVEVKVRDVECHELCSRSGDHAVEENFEKQHVRCGGADVTWIVDSVAAQRRARAMLLLFLLADVADKLTVSDVFEAIRWYLSLFDEEARVGWFGDAAADTLEEAPKLIRRGVRPLLLELRALDELAVVEHLAQRGVEHGEGNVEEVSPELSTGQPLGGGLVAEIVRHC